MMENVKHKQVALFAAQPHTRLKIALIRIRAPLDIKNAIIPDLDPDHIDADLILEIEITEDRTDTARIVDTAKEEKDHIPEINIPEIDILVILEKKIDRTVTKLEIEEKAEDPSAKAIHDLDLNQEA
jgi:hypothetical protein